MDERAAQEVLDRLRVRPLRDDGAPGRSAAYLCELGERWERGTASVAQEHFATNVIRGRLAGLARGWGNGHGPRAVLACPPGELHDLALMVFGIVLHRSGWRIDYLGMNTPVEELTRTVDARHPDLVVVAATLRETLGPLAAQLTALAQHAPLALGSRRHAGDRERGGGPADDARPSNRGRANQLAAVKLWAPGCPRPARCEAAWP